MQTQTSPPRRHRLTVSALAALTVTALALAGCSSSAGGSGSSASSSPSASSSAATDAYVIPGTIANGPGIAPAAPSGNIPQLTGQLFFHNYTSYEAGDGRLWQLDLATGRLARISDGWPITNTINPHISADGKSMVFMGQDAASGDGNWDVYLSTWDGTRWGTPKNLTGPNDKSDEDPKFSPDGSHIVFKIDGAVTEMTPDGTVTRTITGKDPEAGQPYYLPNGKDIMYSEGTGVGAKIVEMTADSKRRVLADLPGTVDYYPIGMDDKSFLFTNVQAETKYDRIMQGHYDGSTPTPYFFDSNTADHSDAYPYEDGSKYLFYVTTDGDQTRGGYDIQVADLTAKKVYSIQEWNPLASSALDEVGLVWSASAQFPESEQVLEPEMSPPPGQLLSQGKPATASSTYPDHTPGMANDGVVDGTDCWCVADENVMPSPYWQVDLGVDHEISGLLLHFWPGVPDIWYYSIATSSDEKTWNTIIDARSNGQLTDRARLVLANPVKARYVRVVFNSLSAGRNWPGLLEAQVYGS